MNVVVSHVSYMQIPKQTQTIDKSKGQKAAKVLGKKQW